MAKDTQTYTSRRPCYARAASANVDLRSDARSQLTSHSLPKIARCRPISITLVYLQPSVWYTCYELAPPISGELYFHLSPVPDMPAIRQRNAQIVRMLLDARCNPNVEVHDWPDNHHTALDSARRERYEDIFLLLTWYCAEGNKPPQHQDIYNVQISVMWKYRPVCQQKLLTNDSTCQVQQQLPQHRSPGCRQR